MPIEYSDLKSSGLGSSRPISRLAIFLEGVSSILVSNNVLYTLVYYKRYNR